MAAFAVPPEHGGPGPVVFDRTDAPGLRPAPKDRAARLAHAVYDVTLPCLDDRRGPCRGFGRGDEDVNEVPELPGTLMPTPIASDARAMLPVVAADPAARGGPWGAVRVCVRGGPTLSWTRTRLARPGRRGHVHARCLASWRYAGLAPRNLDEARANVDLA